MVDKSNVLDMFDITSKKIKNKGGMYGN